MYLLYSCYQPFCFLGIIKSLITQFVFESHFLYVDVNERHKMFCLAEEIWFVIIISSQANFRTINVTMFTLNTHMCMKSRSSSIVFNNEC